MIGEPGVRATCLAPRTAGLATMALVAMVICGCGGGSGGALSDSLAGWNVVLVTLDTTRQDHLGCYGDTAAQTPNLDRLADRGTRFDRAVAHAPITLPTHASIHTGLYPPTHGVRGNGVYALPGSRETLAEILSQRGYDTGAAVGAFVLDRRYGLAQGFDHYDDNPEGMRQNDVNDSDRSGFDVTAAALDIVDRFEKGNPFFLWAHYFDPHHPYEAPDTFASRYGSDRRGRYAAEVAAMDAAVGDLLDGLRRRGLMKKTLVVVVADHGEGITGPHAEKTHGLLVYRDTIDIPLIFQAEGGLPGGRVDSGLSRQIDVAPTVLELLEIPVPTVMEGDSLAARLRDPDSSAAPAAHDDIADPGSGGGEGSASPEPLSYSETFMGWDSYGWSPLFAVESSRWKYIEGARRELYDLASDPDETSNVAATHPEVVAELAGRLAEIRGSDDFTGGEFARSLVPDDSDAERLRNLGYVESAQSPVQIADPADLRHPADSLHLFELLDEVRFLHSNKKYDTAVAKLQGLIDEDPRNYLATAQMAQLKADQKKFVEAQDWYRKLVDLRPNDASSYGRLATAQLKHAAALKNSGQARLAAEMERRSAANYEKAIELDSVDVATYVNLGRYLSRNKQLDRAVDLLETAIAIDARNATAYFLLGFCHLELGEYDDALTALETAFRHAAGNESLLVSIQRIRSTVYLRKNDKQQAAEQLQWVLDTYPRHPQIDAVRSTLEKIRRL